MLNIYYKLCDTDDLPEINGMFSDCRTNKILSVSQKKTRLLEYCAALVIRAGLSSLGIDERCVRYDICENGKPYFPELPNVNFSLSHSGNMAICVFSEKSVGIDCEHISRKVDTKTLNRFFDAESILNYSGKELDLWVVKESLAKLSGKGLLIEGKTDTVPYFDKDFCISGKYLQKFILEDHIVCVASETATDFKVIKV